MRLTGVSARGLLSFAEFSLDLSERITVVVGPNGAGKSNLGRVLELVRCAVEHAHRSTNEHGNVLATYLAGRRADLPVDGIEVRLGFELTSDEERELLVTFVRAATEYQLLGQTSGTDTSTIEAWVSRQMTFGKLSPLFRGSIVVSHSGLPDGQWTVSMDFTAAASRRQRKEFRWMLSPGQVADAIVALDDVGTAAGGETIAHRLLGKAPNTSGIPAAPSGVFAFARMLPKARRTASCAIDLGRPATQNARRLTELIGVDPLGHGEHNHHYGLAVVIATILRQSLVQIDHARLRRGEPARKPYRVQDLHGPAEDLPRALFLLKNAEATERPRYDGVCQRFWEFSGGRQLDVFATEPSNGASEGRADILPRVLVSIDTVEPESRASLRQVPIEFAGAGAWEALVLAAAFDVSDASVVVLDEPGVALHPTMQKRITQHLATSGAQFVVITHSQHLVPYEIEQTQLRIVRLERDVHSATQCRTVDPTLFAKISRKLIEKGNGGLPFAARLILCEGYTDVQCVRALAERIGFDLDGRNVGVLDCGSRDNLPDYVAVCGSFGIRFLALMDGDATKAATDGSVRRNAEAVRIAVRRHPIGTLIEFPEDIETTLQVKKRTGAAPAKIRMINLGSGGKPELQYLVQMMRDLVASP